MTSAPLLFGQRDFPRERMLVVCEGMVRNGVLDQLRAHYPQFSISVCDTYLTAIAEAARQPADVVLTGVDASLPRLEGAMEGLRDAAGPRARLLVCCEPLSEGIARRMLEHGADDYVLLPLHLDEVDEAIGVPIAAPAVEVVDEAGVASSSPAEVDAIGALLADIECSPRELLDRLAALVRVGLPASGVSVVVQGSMASSGEAVSRPVLSEPIRVDERVVGQLLLGSPEGRAYTRGDVEKLSRYAMIAGRVLSAASRLRGWREKALTDELSGIANRRAFMDELDEILARAAAERFPVTVLMFDVDDFKSYNDRCGHDAGDEIIRATARLMRRQCREKDVVARFGGDEFAVVFWDASGPRSPGSKHPEQPLAILRRFSEALALEPLPPSVGAGGGALTISGGLATYPWDATARDELIKRADEALLAAKRAGKNRVFLIGEHAGEVAVVRPEQP